MQFVKREAVDEREDPRAWKDWTLTPRSQSERGVQGNFAKVSKALMAGLLERRLLKPRANVSFDDWTATQARRTISDPSLFAGLLLERPEVRFARQKAGKGAWPYGSLDGITARVVGAAVEALDGNVRAASRTLEISHTTTMRWLKAYRELIEAGELPEPRSNRLLSGD